MKASLTKQIISVISILFFCVSVSIASEPNETTTETTKQDATYFTDFGPSLQNHSLEIGSEIYFFDYREPGGISDKGAFLGGILNYTYRGWVPDTPNTPLPENGISLRAELRYANGEADYDGSLSNGVPYKIKGIEYNAYETRFL